MLNKIYINVVLMFVVSALPLFGTSFHLPEYKEYYSADHVFRLEVFPPTHITIYDALALQRGDYFQITMAYPDRSPCDFQPTGRLSRLHDGHYDTIWRRSLENAVSPLAIEIVDMADGPYVVSLNDFFLFKDSSAAIVIYAPTGKTIKKFSLHEVVPEEELNRAFLKIDTVNLLNSYKIINGKITINLQNSLVDISLKDGLLTR
jgi:hypothetical protein